MTTQPADTPDGAAVVTDVVIVSPALTGISVGVTAGLLIVPVFGVE